MRSRYLWIVSLMALALLWLAQVDGSEGRSDAPAAPEYAGPCALAASKDGTTLYVACADARHVAWIDLRSGMVTRRVVVEGEPTGVVLTPDGTRLVVTCAAPRSTVAVIDSASGQRLASIPAGHTAMGPAVSPDGAWLYVCNRFNNDVSVIDLRASKERARVPAEREPIAAAVTPDGRTVLVANHLPSTRTDSDFKGEVAPRVTVIDSGTLETTTIELYGGANGLRGVCVSPDGAHAFVTHLLSNFLAIPFRVDMGWINVNVVSILDVKQRKVISTIGLDELGQGVANPWDVVCADDGRSVCVSQAGTHELSIIDRSDLLSDLARRTMSPMPGAWPVYPSLGGSLWRRVKLPGNGPRGLTSAGSKIYVAEYFSDTVAVVDLHAPLDSSPGAIPLGPASELTLERRGQMLFHDATICYQQWQSCASCHPDGRQDSLNWDLMNDGVGNPKNTKSLLLAHRTPPAMSVGVRESAEEAVRAGLSGILFSDRPEHEAAAIDAYLKSLRPVPSPHLVDGKLSVAAQRGQQLFHSERIGCHRCHPAPLFTDLKPYDVGTRNKYENENRFDTPTLVEVWRTAPYLHDGRYTTIRQLLIEGRHGLKNGRDRELDDRQMEDLVEFVLSL